MDIKNQYLGNLTDRALGVLELQLKEELSSGIRGCTEHLVALKANGGARVQDEVCRLLTQLQSDISSGIKEPFNAIVEIAAANALSPDPTEFASAHCRSQIRQILQQPVDPDHLEDPFNESSRLPSIETVLFGTLDELLPDAELGELMTDFWVDVEDALGELALPAQQRLARGGWRPRIVRNDPSSTETESDVVPEAKHYSCSWFKRAGVWHISVPDDAENVLTVPDSVGLAYIQVILKQAPQDLSASQVQALARADSALVARVEAGLSTTLPEVNGLGFGAGDSADDAIDSHARIEIWNRLKSLDVEIAAAERNNNRVELENLRSEREEILDYWRSSLGKGGRLGECVFADHYIQDNRGEHKLSSVVQRDA